MTVDRFLLSIIAGLLVATFFFAVDASTHARLATSQNEALARQLDRNAATINAKLDMLASQQTGAPEGGYGAEGFEGRGDRIIPATKDAISEVRDFLARADQMLTDIQDGRYAITVEGSLLAKQHTITIQRK